MPQLTGIISGIDRDNAVYLVGTLRHQGKIQFLYLDPHFINEPDTAAQRLETYHRNEVALLKTPLNHLSQALCLGFYLKSRKDLASFEAALAQMKRKHGPELFLTSFKEKPRDLDHSFDFLMQDQEFQEILFTERSDARSESAEQLEDCDAESEPEDDHQEIETKMASQIVMRPHLNPNHKGEESTDLGDLSHHIPGSPPKPNCLPAMSVHPGRVPPQIPCPTTAGPRQP